MYSSLSLKMTVAHVEALRLENHFLRQSLDEKKSDEKEVVEMQKKYHNVIDLTEVNFSLRKNNNKKSLFNLFIPYSDLERKQKIKKRNSFIV